MKYRNKSVLLKFRVLMYKSVDLKSSSAGLLTNKVTTKTAFEQYVIVMKTH